MEFTLLKEEIAVLPLLFHFSSAFLLSANCEPPNMAVKPIVRFYVDLHTYTMVYYCNLLLFLWVARCTEFLKKRKMNSHKLNTNGSNISRPPLFFKSLCLL